MSGTEADDFLEPTPFLDWDRPEVAAYAERNAEGAAGEVEVAVRLYYAVRDDIRYDPYSTRLSVEGLRASSTLAARRAWCVPKAILLAACCRALGVPARLGFADVRNHMATARLREHMKTDVFYWHGYASIFLEGRWIKATPAFNIELCQKFRLPPLEFDGRKDSIHQTFDAEGSLYMEYLQFRGEYKDVPLDEITATFREKYAAMVSARMEGDFHREAEEENPPR